MIGFSQSTSEQSFALSSTIDEQDPSENVQVDTMPRPTSYLAPNYPANARKLGVEATIWLKMVINEKGEASKIVVFKSNLSNNEGKNSENQTPSKEVSVALDSLNAAAVATAKQWKFTPAVLNGKPTKVWVTIPFKFRLEPSKPDSKTKKNK